jgi:piezo-type mechanosensitive ion channel component 1/2
VYLKNISEKLGMDDFSDSSPEIPFYFIYQFYDIIIACLLLSFQTRVIYKTETLVKYKKRLMSLQEQE